MASGNLSFETAQITYTDGGAQTYTLRQPLSGVTPGLRWGGQWVAESLDGSVREVLTIAGSEIYLIEGMIRYEDQPGDLVAMILAGQKGITLNYYPDTTGQPGVFVACNLVAPAPGREWRASLERTGPVAPREKALQITLQRTDETAFPSWVFNY